MGSLAIYVSGFLCLCFIYVLVQFLNKVWLAPIRTQSTMRSQRILGPSYRFLYGNIREISNIKKKTTSRPMELSYALFPRIMPHVYSWIRLYGMNFLYWHGTRPFLVITELELIKEVLNNKDKTYCRTSIQENGRKLLGDGLALSRGEKWLKMRKLANHAFHADSLKNMVPAMIASAEAMIKRWTHHEGKEIEVFHEFKALTSEVISRTAFGSSYQEGEQIFSMLNRMTQIIGTSHLKVGIPWVRKLFKTNDDIETDQLEQRIRDAIINIIKKREETMKADVDGPGSDFLQVLLNAYKDPDSTKKITLDEVIDECKVLYVAGQETTASALTWTVLLLAIHTDWQDKARNEVLELFGQDNPTAAGIARMKIVSMIINESLRLFPPAVALLRKAERESRLGNLIIPAGMDIIIPNLAAHIDPQIWGDDAHLFKPERFAEGLAKATSNNVSAFLPFGLGPRICVGMSFAATEMKIALSMILQHYRFTLSHNYVHSPVQFITMCPQHGAQIMLKAL